MLQTRLMSTTDKSAVVDLFVKSFVDNHLYRKFFPEDREEKVSRLAKLVIDYLVEEGCSYVVTDKDKLVAFLWTTNYDKLKLNKEMLTKVFSPTNNLEDNQYYKIIEEHINNLHNCLFILSCAVAEEYRNKGIAKQLISLYFGTSRDKSIVCDVANPLLLSVFKELEFDILTLDNDYWLCIHKGD